ncbi:MAG: hypothetical protein ACQKBV_06445 [Puniceicoccales bacterium]
MSKRIFKFSWRQLVSALALTSIAASPCAAQDSAFGSDDANAALIGILYDLKQTQKGDPSGVGVQEYPLVLSEFMESDWDEAVLNRFFRVSRPVYASKVFVPMMSAGQAPKAFRVDEVVDPRLIVVHYKGQVVAPMDGVYRLAGFADDFIAARVNGDTVLVAGRGDCLSPITFPWEAKVPDGFPIGNGRVRFGNWFAVRKGEAIDLDVLIGERPGGDFGAWLYIERKGESYPAGEGSPLLPVFQFAEDVGRITGGRHAEPRESSVWKAVQ